MGTFSSTGKFNVEGNAMSMLYGDDFTGKKDLTGKSYAFYKLFNGCTNVVEAHNLILPAITLANGCYYRMFQICTSLTTAPELPATLASDCYSDMFYGCTSLTTAPSILPATTLSSGCYYRMFYDCSKLNNIVMLATDISATNCLLNWVSGVASTGTFTKHKDMTSLPTGVSGIPEGWEVKDYGIDDDYDEGYDENQYEYVDLGLSVKWATCNVGATKPEEYGLYFAWGETEGYTGITDTKKFKWDDYKYGTNYSNMTKYNSTDGLTTLELTDDAARVNMGGNWRMPTYDECQELINNTTPAWTTENGVEGIAFTSNKEGYTDNYIFVPFAGTCVNGSVNNTDFVGSLWSSSFYDSLSAHYLYYYSDDAYLSESNRYIGYPVRGVLE